MKKRIIALSLILIMSLSGCGKGNKGTDHMGNNNMDNHNNFLYINMLYSNNFHLTFHIKHTIYPIS